MASLTAKDPFGPLLPITHGSVEMSEVTGGAVTWIAPLAGREGDVSAALEAQVGAAFPEVGGSTLSDNARVIWAGPGQAFVLGPELDLIDGAALVDHSSAWARFALEGAHAAEVLARLIAVDLRDGAFSVGRVARTQLGHMSCVLLRTGPSLYEVMVFRSMAASAAHEVSRAMEMVAARAGLDG